MDLSPTTKKRLIIVGCIVVVAAIAVYWYTRKVQPPKESYLSAGAMDHLDSLDSRYELIESPDNAVPTEHFADLVDTGEQQSLVQQPNRLENSLHPLERLERLQDQNTLPLTAANLSPYNVDVANIGTYAFAVNAPRVVLKNRLAMQADPLRGDPPIKYFPEVPLIAVSSNGRDSLRMDGLFTDYFQALYNKQTGRAYKNMPIKVATQGTVMDYIENDQ